MLSLKRIENVRTDKDQKRYLCKLFILRYLQISFRGVGNYSSFSPTFIHYCHKQILLEWKIIEQSCLWQSAGLGDFRLARFLIVQFGKHPQGIFQYFVPVCDHISLAVNFRWLRYNFPLSFSLWSDAFYCLILLAFRFVEDFILSGFFQRDSFSRLIFGSLNIVYK